ncbi:hypothetical protein GSI_08324 [Ganoderma sinense ZZ0214-1]|uniref:Uncharacterized protein n=1 Tax=Ganoderma sinense ZZ0214-1 TaxID=1077348 RepID=A0A2G8S6W9_9APHY|nr:hypothetical protein GSI_08324 [Ganoderma sinense ZZ0214-1]
MPGYETTVHARPTPEISRIHPPCRQLSWLDPHGPEYILTAIGSSGARSLKHLYIDCPAVPVDSESDDEGPENRLLDLDLSHCTSLRDLWVSVPYPLPQLYGVDLRIADRFASVLASWAPASASAFPSAQGEGGDGGGRTLTITPTFESDFTRAQFVDVLRAFGPVAEAALLDPARGIQDEETHVCVCVIDHPEKRAWWADTVVRECFPRMHARGRVRAAFWKRYWDDSVWSEDNPDPLAAAAVVLYQPADTTVVHPTPAADVLTAPDVAEGSQDNVDAGDGAALQLVPLDAPEAQTLPGLVTPARGGRRSRARSFKKMPGLVLARITKVARALVRRNA